MIKLLKNLTIDDILAGLGLAGVLSFLWLLGFLLHVLHSCPK